MVMEKGSTSSIHPIIEPVMLNAQHDKQILIFQLYISYKTNLVFLTTFLEPPLRQLFLKVCIRLFYFYLFFKI